MHALVQVEQGELSDDDDLYQPSQPPENTSIVSSHVIDNATQMHVCTLYILIFVHKKLDILPHYNRSSLSHLVISVMALSKHHCLQQIRGTLQ